MRDHRGLWAGGAAAAALLSGQAALAQDAQVSTLEEVVVTAQRRAQSLQDVPVTVTAFGAEQVEEARIREVQDVATLTPGLQFDAFPSSQPRIAIRGIGSSDRGAAVGGADATDRNARLRRRKGVKLQAGRERRDVLDLANARLLHLLGAEGGDGDRDVLQALRAPLGGDDHLLQGADLGVLGKGGLPAEQGRRGRAARPKASMISHVSTPRLVLAGVQLCQGAYWG